MTAQPARLGRPPKPLSDAPIKNLTVRLALSLHTRFKIACVARHVELADTVRELVEGWVRRQEAGR
jgi:hypothetical protein